AVFLIADVEIAAAPAVRPASGHEYEEALVGGDAAFVLVGGAVDGGPEVLGPGKLAVGAEGAVQVGLAVSARAIRAEVQGAVGGHAREPLVAGAVHRRPEVARLAPVADLRPLHHPDVHVLFRLTIDRAVGDEVEQLAIGRDERVGIAVLARERRDLRLGPAALRVVADVDSPVGESGSALHEVERAPVRRERGVGLVVPRGDDAFAKQDRLGQRLLHVVGRHAGADGRPREQQSDQGAGYGGGSAWMNHRDSSLTSSAVRADRQHYFFSLSTGLRRTPMPSISASTTSLGRR